MRRHALLLLIYMDDVLSLTSHKDTCNKNIIISYNSDIFFLVATTILYGCCLSYKVS